MKISPDDTAVLQGVCARFGNDPTRLMDVLMEVQKERGCIDNESGRVIAESLGLPWVVVRSAATFYSFLTENPAGGICIRVCTDTVDKIKGASQILFAFEEELGISVGEVTADGCFGLEETACIGMSDQAPSALIGDVVANELTPDAAREIVRALRKHGDPSKLVLPPGDGNNGDPAIKASIKNNIRQEGPVIFAPFVGGSALNTALQMTPEEIVEEVKVSRLRGRGGAGFPTGLKWEFARGAREDRKYLVCNADEGEPGTFKDRVILTERPDLLFEGMTIGGYATGAKHGIIYLRGEYTYLKGYLEEVLGRRRSAHLLGKDICGHAGVDFDIRIQLGAGAYVCGEETALLSSCEGRRGDPKNRPPFPAQKGYLGYPTTVNNVETLCCVARILEMGANWFTSLGSRESRGTKVLSVCGDCKKPGVYEVEFGVSLARILERAGAEGAAAVQVGGPSGKMVGPGDFEREICFNDLATGGSIIVLGPETDPLWVAREFTRFFMEESCGYCTPCRAGGRLLLERMDRIMAGTGLLGDLDYLEQLARTVVNTSRCGLGQTAGNPILSSLECFRARYLQRLSTSAEGLLPSFDATEALRQGEKLAGRRSEHLGDDGRFR